MSGYCAINTFSWHSAIEAIDKYFHIYKWDTYWVNLSEKVAVM